MANYVNQAPSVDAGGPYLVREGEVVDLEASGSDPDGDTLTYSWDRDGDGIFESAGQGMTFSAAGLDGPSTQTVRVQSTDPYSLSAAADATVIVLNADPTVTSSFPAGGVGRGSNNGVLDITLSDSGFMDKHTVSVDWGDGSVPETDTNATSHLRMPHNYAHAGQYNATVPVTDDDGGVGSDDDNPITVGLTIETGGILPPINQDGTSVFKYGSTIPVKVKLQDCDGSYPATLAPKIQVQMLSGATPVWSINEPVSTSTVDTSGIMRFDAASGQYLYNLATKPLPDPTAIYRVIITIPLTEQTVTNNFGLRT
jgi:hypothetical protein